MSKLRRALICAALLMVCATVIKLEQLMQPGAGVSTTGATIYALIGLGLGVMTWTMRRPIR